MLQETAARTVNATVLLVLLSKLSLNAARRKLAALLAIAVKMVTASVRTALAIRKNPAVPKQFQTAVRTKRVARMLTAAKTVTVNARTALTGSSLNAAVQTKNAAMTLTAVLTENVILVRTASAQEGLDAALGAKSLLEWNS